MQTDPRQPNLFDPPPPVPGGVRHDDPETSREAAESIDANTLEGQVHADLLKHGPSTLDDICRRMKLDKVTASPRFKPLERAGMVIRAGKRPGNSGRPQTIWQAVPRVSQ